LTNARVVICGAGIAGVATAYHLAVQHGIRKVILVDERPPLSLTSDKSTECYRNFWPDPGGAMVRMMNRGIDLLEGWAHESNNVFHMNRRGYAFATAEEAQAEDYAQAGLQAEAHGAGPLRVHRAGETSYIPPHKEDFQGQPDGADLILDPVLIRQHYPFFHDKTLAVLHTRRAGWLSAQQLGMYLLHAAQDAGVELIQDRVVGVATRAGRVDQVDLAARASVKTDVFVNAAGPHLHQVAKWLGLDLPVYSELHLKAAFQDHLGVVPRDVPMLIWGDEQTLQWTDSERRSLDGDEDFRWLLEPLPSGVHTRPEGGGGSEVVLALWEYNPLVLEPVFPPPLDPVYPEIVIRGLCAMLPGMSAYLKHLPQPWVDGGYYTRTEENRPLVGPLPVDGAYVIGALSGFGIMAAPGLGELLARHITGSSLPDYAPAFALDRYDDPVYRSMIERGEDSWQL
jgi:glycine/D-amino acid oxidase-like deaminating enzyme